MTEQEAEEFAERLRRIWKPMLVSNEHLQVEWHLRKGQLTFKSPITEDVAFFVGVIERSYFLLLGRKQKGVITGSLTCDLDTGQVGGAEFVEPELQKDFDQFARDWLTFFRRNCWLSGGDVEASAHEKVEWMQGFTKEEIETWNLKM